MNLVIDIGNTSAKVAVFQQNELVEKWTVDKLEVSEKIKKIFSDYPGLLGVIISKVAKVDVSLPIALQKNARLVNLHPGTALPFHNLYATPETLGNDRKALVAAAVKKFPGQNVLVIDAGTCVTYDFKNQREEYLGGAISPGMRMRFKALNAFTANLPLVDPGREVQNHGNTTVTSIQSGVALGLVHEVEGFIQDYSKSYENLVVIITGGDAHFLSVNLKNSIFANSNILLEGLNQILEFNIN